MRILDQQKNAYITPQSQDSNHSPIQPLEEAPHPSYPTSILSAPDPLPIRRIANGPRMIKQRPTRDGAEGDGVTIRVEGVGSLLEEADEAREDEVRGVRELRVDSGVGSGRSGS